MSTKNNYEIEDLRNHMFAQLERLKDPTLDLEKEMKRAQAIVSVGNVIVNSAKAEVDFIRATKAAPTKFLNGSKKQKHLGDGK